MVFGMLPLALGLEAGGSQREPLGIVVIGGLTSSLLLSLLVIPIVYMRFTRPSTRPTPPPPDGRGAPNDNGDATRPPATREVVHHGDPTIE
jgi:hypothetical protein